LSLESAETHRERRGQEEEALETSQALEPVLLLEQV
jgi:hypothetical protein